MPSNPLRSNTPIECYDDIYVKREDLCVSPDSGAPPLAKLRGIYAFVRNRPEKVIGVLDASHSRNGWATAWVCSQLKKQCVDFYPVQKANWDAASLYPVMEAPAYQKAAWKLGAKLSPLPATRSAILYATACRRMEECRGHMIPNAMKMLETIRATADEVIRTESLPKLGPSRIVIPVGTATIATGVLRGLFEMKMFKPKIVLHLGYSRAEPTVLRYISHMGGFRDIRTLWDLKIVDEGYDYKDEILIDNPPFPMCTYYETKTWHWMQNNFVKNSLLWNVGG